MKYDEFLKGDNSLLEKQVEGVDYLAIHQWVILADEMGNGKSIQSLVPSFIDKFSTLIICPSNLKLNWKREIEKFCPHEARIKVIEKAKDIDSIDFEEDYIIVSYDLSKQLGFVFEMCRCWIFDEAHYLKNWASKRSQYIREMAYVCRPHYFFLLTGTPITKTAEDWLNYLFLMGRCPWGTNGAKVQDLFKTPEHFYNTFCKYESTNAEFRMRGKTHRVVKKKYIGLKEENLHRLDELLEGKYLRRTSDEIQELPPIQHKEIILSESVNEELALAFERYDKNPRDSRMSIMEAKEKSAYVKVRRTLAYALDLQDEVREPILIYSDHIGAAEKLCVDLRGRKQKVEVITGRTKSDKRQLSVDRFTRGELDFLVATIGSSNTGYNLTNCRNIIFNDLSWRADQNLQVEKRIHRKGQTGSCMIHRIIGDATDEHILRILERKISDIRRLVK